MALSILIADDHDVVRRGLKSIYRLIPVGKSAPSFERREAVELAGN